MRRFFCNPQNITSQHIEIQDKKELHHLKDVLRLKPKDRVVVLNGQGGEFICQINQIDKRRAKLDIVEKHIYEKPKSRLNITIACALPKNSKIDFIVEKLAEIGAERIILLKTERTEVKLKDPSKK
ncbi:RsmE family RNA methyltransferase, partial [Candidatus Omnitrophota bacterium]